MLNLLKRKKTRISIIVWDASFRESFHTIDYFCKQNYPNDEFEFIWVDFYENRDSILHATIARYPQARLLNLCNSDNTPWHLGVCINEGVRQSRGDILVIPDGDVVVSDGFLDIVNRHHSNREDLALYFRRYDEPRDAATSRSREDITYLKQRAQLIHPLNYGGCLSLKRTNFEAVNGYETHNVFAGAGMIGMEIYIRLRNFGLSVKWVRDVCVYHPWHANTSDDGFNEARQHQVRLNNWAKVYYPWINQYYVEQSWVANCRERDLSYRADGQQCEGYLSRIPAIDHCLFEQIDSLFATLQSSKV